MAFPFKSVKNEINLEEIAITNLGSVLVQTLFDKQAMSIATVQLIGNQKFGYNTKSNMIYFVLEGQGKFFIEDEKYDVKEGCAIYIPKDTCYRDSGKMKLLAIAFPKFESDERILLN